MSGGTPDRVSLALASLFVVLVAMVPALATHPHGVYDTFSYTANPSFTSGRLPLVPALYWLLRHNDHAIGVIQAVFGAVCWLALLWELSHVRTTAIRLTAMVGVVCLACSSYVVDWYAALLSESLSISLLALLFFFLARWQRTGSTLWPAIAVAGASALIRPTSAYILLLAAVVLTAYTLIRRRNEIPKVAVLLALAICGTWLSGQGRLWQQPFLHSLSERILPSPEYTRWFQAHGMPTDTTLTHLAGPYTPAVDATFNKSPALNGFRTWMDKSAEPTYALFIASHPGWAITGTFGRHEELTTGLIKYYGSVSRPWYPPLLRNLLLSRRQDVLAAIGTADLLVIALALARHNWTSQTTLWLGIITLGLLSLVIDWAGDSWEVGRHSVEGTVTLVLAGLLLHTSHERRATRQANTAITTHHLQPTGRVDARYSAATRAFDGPR